MLYFDHNATTPMSDSAREAWLSASRDYWGNASAGYRLGVKAKASLERARERLAVLLNVEPDQLIFCSGATEACNLWIRSFLDRPSSVGKLLVSELDHSCIVETCKHLGQERISWFTPSVSGEIDEQLDALFRVDSSIEGVVMMAANNVTGEIFDWKQVASWCRKKGIPFFCDTTQLIGKYDESELGLLDFFCGSAHKFGGPKGIGFLKISRKFHQLGGQIGGGQEQGMRGGTEDVASVLSMVAALEESFDRGCEPGAIQQRLRWKNTFKNRLGTRIPGTVFHDRTDSVLWNTVYMSLPQKESGWWIQQLDQRGVAIAAGSACSSQKPGVSRVMKVLGVEESIAKRSVRLSAGWGTTENDWNALLTGIVAVYSLLQSDESRDPSGFGEVISLEDL